MGSVYTEAMWDGNKEGNGAMLTKKAIWIQTENKLILPSLDPWFFHYSIIRIKYWVRSLEI